MGIDFISTFKAHGYKQHHTSPLSIPEPPMQTVIERDELRFLYNSNIDLDAMLYDTKVIKDQRGAMVEVHRNSWHGLQLEKRDYPMPHPGHVSQAYISMTKTNVVKGWHVHQHQTDKFVCIRGAVAVSLYDLRPNEEYGSPYPEVKTFVLDSRWPQQLVIPPGIAHGWLALDHPDGEAWILNLVSAEYDGTDEWRRDPHAGPSELLKRDDPAWYFEWRGPVDG